MTVIQLAYGSDGLPLRAPQDRTTVVTPAYARPAADPAVAVRTALREPVAGQPLREIISPGQTVAISVCDGTRAQPRDVMIPVLLGEMDGIVRDDDITIVVATGTHRANTDSELRAMFGDQVVDRIRIVNHDARDDSRLRWCGRFGNDVPVWLNSDWLHADIRITTGFVEPHFFAGFSGGPKMVAPGLAGLDTVLTLHDAYRIGHPKATWAITQGNPVHDDVRAIAAGIGVHFSCDVVLNRDQKIVRAFGGELFAMHAAACAVARDTAMVPVDSPFDVVVTTNSGFPLDQNLYQSVKGMSAAAQVVAEGGTIVCAAECRDGLPDHGSYREVLTSADTPAELAAAIAAGPVVPDQWQVQVQSRIQSKARVIMHTGYLSDETLASAHLEQTHDISATVAQLLARDPGARLCVLPEGPQTIPYLAPR